MARWPDVGKPKVPPVARSLVDLGLMRLDTSQHLPRLFFTEAGLFELRVMGNRRLRAGQLARAPVAKPRRKCSVNAYGYFDLDRKVTIFNA
jgi:hypothetical protein